jgi:hypothetical protein
MWFIGRELKRGLKGIATHGMGWLAGGAQNFSVLFIITIITSTVPLGGEGTSHVRFCTYRSMGIAEGVVVKR